MKRMLVAAAGTGLALTVLPSLLLFAGVLSMQANLQLMLAGTLLWFAAASLLPGNPNR